MEYAVIVEQSDGVWSALIPALPRLAAEGASRDEAVRNAQRAAEDYLSKVEVTTIEINLSPRQVRADSAESLLSSAGMFKGDEEAMREHIEEIYAERRRQRDEAERALDEAERRINSPDADEHAA